MSSFFIYVLRIENLDVKKNQPCTDLVAIYAFRKNSIERRRSSKIFFRTSNRLNNKVINCITVINNKEIFFNLILILYFHRILIRNLEFTILNKYNVNLIIYQFN